MLLLIDNYDSFTFNLVQYFQELRADVVVHRNDKISVAAALALKPAQIVLSPGPCAPDQAGICLDLIKAAAEIKTPLLGVCLGHQAMGQALGGKVVRAALPMHGKVSAIRHHRQGIFKDIPSPINVTRYHSLVVEKSSLPQTLEATAETTDGIIMAMQHKNLPMWGVQFHPESILTQHGYRMLFNFLALSRDPQLKLEAGLVQSLSHVLEPLQQQAYAGRAVN